MKTSQLVIISLFVTSILAAAGCEKTDGEVVLKEPRKELGEMPPPMIWDASDPDKSRRATRERDGSYSDPHTGLPAK